MQINQTPDGHDGFRGLDAIIDRVMAKTEAARAARDAGITSRAETGPLAPTVREHIASLGLGDYVRTQAIARSRLDIGLALTDGGAAVYAADPDVTINLFGAAESHRRTGCLIAILSKMAQTEARLGRERHWSYSPARHDMIMRILRHERLIEAYIARRVAADKPAFDV